MVVWLTFQAMCGVLAIQICSVQVKTGLDYAVLLCYFFNLQFTIIRHSQALPTIISSERLQATWYLSPLSVYNVDFLQIRTFSYPLKFTIVSYVQATTTSSMRIRQSRFFNLLTHQRKKNNDNHHHSTGYQQTKNQTNFCAFSTAAPQKDVDACAAPPLLCACVEFRETHRACTLQRCWSCGASRSCSTPCHRWIFLPGCYSVGQPESPEDVLLRDGSRSRVTSWPLAVESVWSIPRFWCKPVRLMKGVLLAQLWTSFLRAKQV